MIRSRIELVALYGFVYYNTIKDLNIKYGVFPLAALGELMVADKGVAPCL